MLSRVFFKSKIFIILSMLVSSINADVAFQEGWDRAGLNPGNIYNEAELTEFLQNGECQEVNIYSNNGNHSAVVARGLHTTADDPRRHYTVRLYNCPPDQLIYEGPYLQCNIDDWAGTYHVLENSTCP